MDNLDKCEICYELFDDDENMNKPYCLFPCGHSFCITCILSLDNELCAKCKTSFTGKAPNWSLIEKINGGYTSIKANQLLTKGFSIIEEFKDNYEKLKDINKVQISKIKDEINERESFLLNQIKSSKIEILKIVDDFEKENEESFNENSLKKDEFVSKFKEFERSLDSSELEQVINRIKKEMGNLKDSNRIISDHLIEQKYSLRVKNDNLLYGQLFSNNNPQHLSYSLNNENNSKLFVLYNEIHNGVVDQDEYGYFRQYYPTSHFDNEYVRWKFIDKQSYFLIQNPRSGKYLCSGDSYHSRKVSNVPQDSSFKWTVLYFKINNKDCVVLKSLSDLAYLSSEQYRRYRPGYSNSDGFHMDTNANTDYKSNPYLIWQLLELPFDKLTFQTNNQDQENDDEEDDGEIERYD